MHLLIPLNYPILTQSGIRNSKDLDSKNIFVTIFPFGSAYLGPRNSKSSLRIRHRTFEIRTSAAGIRNTDCRNPLFSLSKYCIYLTTVSLDKAVTHLSIWWCSCLWSLSITRQFEDFDTFNFNLNNAACSAVNNTRCRHKTNALIHV